VLCPPPVNTHDDAKYSTPYTVLRYTTRTTDDKGPKLLPPSATVSPPSVLNTLRPGNDDTDGGVYDVMPDDPELVTPATPPTDTVHTWLAPTPATLTHRIRVCATSTAQPVAVYCGLPALPYVTTTSDPPVPTGPMLVPTRYTASLPTVAIRLPPVVGDPTSTLVTVAGP